MSTCGLYHFITYDFTLLLPCRNLEMTTRLKTGCSWVLWATSPSRGPACPRASSCRLTSTPCTWAWGHGALVSRSRRMGSRCLRSHPRECSILSFIFNRHAAMHGDSTLCHTRTGRYANSPFSCTHTWMRTSSWHADGAAALLCGWLQIPSGKRMQGYCRSSSRAVTT